MLILHQAAHVQQWQSARRFTRHTIGFIPTMGALHEGHLALVTAALNRGDQPVVSIFVNPTQFNDASDLAKYPRTPANDAQLLIGAGADVLFLPDVPEIYPPGKDITVPFDFHPLDTVMEGRFRPGHFKGVATVVKRLLELVNPHRLYLGQKDFQQVSVIAELLRRIHSRVELVRCPTVRAADGLALSSRNQRLTPADRAAAPAIYQVLNDVKTAFLSGENADALQSRALEKLQSAGLRPEYLEIVDGRTLQPLAKLNGHPFAVACLAAWAGEVRLIDNVIIRESEGVKVGG